MKGVVGVKEYFTVPSKMKKLAIITLILGIALGTLILVITAICENNDKNKSHNGLLHQISDEIDNNVGDTFDDSYYDGFNKSYNSTKKYIDKTIDAYGNLYRSSYYLPFYYIGGSIIFISVGSAIALIVLAKVKEDKQEQVNN